MNALVTTDYISRQMLAALSRDFDRPFVVGHTVRVRLPQRYVIKKPAALPALPLPVLAAGVAVAVVAKAAASPEKISRRRFLHPWEWLGCS